MILARASALAVYAMMLAGAAAAERLPGETFRDCDACGELVHAYRSTPSHSCAPGSTSMRVLPPFWLR